MSNKISYSDILFKFTEKKPLENNLLPIKKSRSLITNHEYMINEDLQETTPIYSASFRNRKIEFEKLNTETIKTSIDINKMYSLNEKQTSQTNIRLVIKFGCTKLSYSKYKTFLNENITKVLVCLKTI